MKSGCRGNHGLVGRIVARKIRRRIGFSVPQGLRFRKCGFKIRLKPLHTVDDVIYRTVENTRHRSDAIHFGRLTEVFNPRNTAAGTGFIQEGATVFARKRREFGIVRGQGRLVRRDDMFMRQKCPADVVVRRILSRKDVDDDVNVGIGEDLVRRIGHQRRRRFAGTTQNVPQFDSAAAVRRQRRNALADRTVTEQSNSEHKGLLCKAAIIA